ncbi:hypothetical protein HAX54_049978 [Datura stramonium]|uniref:Uncharacterized protein n=1 Tax=Datura stramonium TaxID=4076 RepID=A0ABS8WKZ2_DATST|nr:hypothetical protein [Datura stramonium]
MGPKSSKGKDVALSSRGNKRSRVGESSQAQEDAAIVPPPARGFGLYWITEQEGKNWFKDYKESKYVHEMKLERDSLAVEFPLSCKGWKFLDQTLFSMTLENVFSSDTGVRVVPLGTP